MGKDHPLPPGGKVGKGLGKGAAAGQDQVWTELKGGDQHKPPPAQLAVGDLQAGQLELLGADQEDVDVKRPRGVTGAVPAAKLPLHLLAGGKQLPRGKLAAGKQAGVVEGPLADGALDRLGLVDGGGGKGRNLPAGKALDALPQGGKPLPHVRAEGEQTAVGL